MQQRFILDRILWLVYGVWPAKDPCKNVQVARNSVKSFSARPLAPPSQLSQVLLASDVPGLGWVLGWPSMY